MARLMMVVGDMQVSVAPVPGSISDALLSVPLPDEHPLMVGDHEVVFFETGVGRNKDAVCAKIMGEADALDVVGLWMLLETPNERPEHRAKILAMMGEDMKAFLP